MSQYMFGLGFEGAGMIAAERVPVGGCEVLVEACRRDGDRRALEQLLDMHGRILNHIVRRYADTSEEPYDDLLQVGYVGLMKAVEGYSSGNGAKFSSYAYSMIDGELRHHFRDTRLVKRPRWATALYAKISQSNSRLTEKLGRPPLVAEIAQEANITQEGVLALLKIFQDTDVYSLEEHDEIDISVIRSAHYEAFSLPIEDRIQLEHALESLSELQRKVVYLFFYKDLSQTEIGRKLGLPQRKVSRIISGATKSLRSLLDVNS